LNGCGLRVYFQNLQGLFAKKPRSTWAVGLTGHVALRHWLGPRRVLWTEVGALGPPVHRGPGGLGGIARDSGVVRGGGAMAAVPWLAVAALRGSGNRAEGTGVMRTSRRSRCACWLREREAGEDGPRGGAVRRRRWNYGELVRAAERGREGEKGTGAILTSLRSSASVLVVADPRTRENDGGAELHSTAAAMAAARRG